MLLTVPAARGQLTTMMLTGDKTTAAYVDWDTELDGYAFKTGDSELTVSWLGYYDAPTDVTGSVGDGLAANHDVGIWEDATGTMIASTTVAAGTGEPLIGAFRGHAVTPVILKKNTTYVIAAPGGGGDRIHDSTDLTGFTVNGVTMLEGRFGGWPDRPANAWDSFLLGPNFGYQAQGHTMALTGESTGQGFSAYGGEVDGYLFRTPPGANLTVGWLGYYDKDGDGLAGAHLVRIWKASGTWPVVASATIPAGTADPLVGIFRGHDIAAVTLEPDTEYVIAAACNDDPMREGNDLAGWGVNGISILAGRYDDPPTADWAIMINANFGYSKYLSVTLNTPGDAQSYPTGSSIAASATVGEPNDALADTVTFHTTPTAPAGPTVHTDSTDTTSPFTADLGALPAGMYEIYATVTNNGTPPGTATSATHTFTIAGAVPTTTTLSSSGSPSTYGQCMLTATVSPVPAGGTVQCYDGGNPFGSPAPVNAVTGEAQLNANTLGAGTRAITATFSGYGVHTASTAAALSQVVEKAELTVQSLNALRAPNTANPDPFPYRITGYQNGETLATSGVTGTPDLTTTATLSSPAGDYPITCALGSLDAANYSFTLQNATLTVAEVADTFSVSFYGYGALPTDEAKANVLVPTGVPAGFGDWFTSGWANIEVPWNPDSPQPPVVLASNRGSAATFTLITCRNGGPYLWATPRTTLLGDGNGNMMDGHVNSTLESSEWFDMKVENIPFALYDVIFYIGANKDQFEDGTGVIVFNGGPERAFTLKPGAFDGTFTEMVDATTAGNYLVFQGVTGSSFTTRTWGTGPGGFNHVGPTGFQIREAAVAIGYDGWKSANDTSQTMELDHDNDGVSNGIEYFIGGPAGHTTGFTALPGVTDNGGVLGVTWSHAADYAGTYGTHFVVETSNSLADGSWTPVDPPSGSANVPGTVHLSGNSLTYSFPSSGARNFARLKVTGP